MTDTQPTDRLDAAVSDYVEAVFREVMRVAALFRRGEPGDLADEIVAELLEHPEPLMARYPDPVRYARERVRHAGISLDRRERVQRGEGALLRPGADGQLRPGRSVVAGDAPVGEFGHSLFSQLEDVRARFDEVAVGRLFDAALLRRGLADLPSRDVAELWLVDGLGLEVREVAELMGQRRETVSRRLNSTRRLARERLLALAAASGEGDLE